MNTKQYYYLSTIAAYGNLSHAAQALHVSPSALSKFLTECEHTFGFTLFLRYNRRLYPTAVGRYGGLRPEDPGRTEPDAPDHEGSGRTQPQIHPSGHRPPTGGPSSSARSTTSSPAATRISP